MYNIVIYEKVRQYRKSHHMTQKELADMLCVSPQTVSKWEKKDCYPDITFLPVLANMLECSVNDFFSI